MKKCSRKICEGSPLLSSPSSSLVLGSHRLGPPGQVPKKISFIWIKISRNRKCNNQPLGQVPKQQSVEGDSNRKRFETKTFICGGWEKGSEPLELWRGELGWPVSIWSQKTWGPSFIFCNKCFATSKTWAASRERFSETQTSLDHLPLRPAGWFHDLEFGWVGFWSENKTRPFATAPCKLICSLSVCSFQQQQIWSKLVWIWWELKVVHVTARTRDCSGIVSTSTYMELPRLVWWLLVFARDCCGFKTPSTCMELVIFNWWWLCVVPLVCWFHWCPVCLFPSLCLPVQKCLLNIFPPKCYFVKYFPPKMLFCPEFSKVKHFQTHLISHNWRFTVRGEDVGHLRYRLWTFPSQFQLKILDLDIGYWISK